MTVTQEQLKPCPFCGCPAEFEHLADGRWSVGCVEGDHDLCIGYQTLTTFSRQAEAITAWNTRAKHREDAERPLLERIEKPEAENAWMAEALHPFAIVNSSEPFLSITVKSSDVQRARQALGETQ